MYLQILTSSLTMGLQIRDHDALYNTHLQKVFIATKYNVHITFFIIICLICYTLGTRSIAAIRSEMIMSAVNFLEQRLENPT